MSENRNCSIDIFRLICAIMVVAIHTAPFVDQNDFIGYVATEVLPRIAVPFFYITAGYFFITKLEKGEDCFVGTLLKVFKLYLFWSAVYFIRNVAVFLFGGAFSLQAVKNFIVGTVLDFVFFGSEYHLWYFIGLMLAIVLVWAAYKVKLQKLLVAITLFLFVLGLLGESYYALGNKLPIVKNVVNISVFTEIRRILCLGVPFFVAGYFVRKATNNVSGKTAVIVTCGLVVAFLLEIVAVNKLELQRGIVLTICLYPLTVFTFITLLKYPMPKLQTISVKSRSLANYTYYVHPLFIWAISCLLDVLGIAMVNVLIMLIVLAVCVLTWLILSKINLKIIKKYVL